MNYDEIRERVELQRRRYTNKKVIFNNGEKYHVLTRGGGYLTTVTVKERTIYEIKSLIAFLGGVLVMIFAYIKPNSVREFFDVFPSVFKNLGEILMYILPFSRKVFGNSYYIDKYRYLFFVSGIFCVIWSLVYTHMLEIKKYKILSAFLLLIAGWYIECSIFPLLVKIKCLFKAKTALIVAVSVSIVCFVVALVAELVLEKTER